jgi:hypothetical protein
MTIASKAHHVRLAHWFFAGGFVWTAVCIMRWLATLEKMLTMKSYAIAFVIGGTLFAIWLRTYRWVNANHADAVQAAAQANQVSKPAKPHERAQDKHVQRQHNSGGINTQQQQHNSGGTSVQQNSSGNNSPNISAPFGIAVGGGTVINPSVTNRFGTPQRHLEPEQKKILKALLKPYSTAAFNGISVMGQDNEAYVYAQDFSEVLEGAGWQRSSGVGQDMGVKVDDPNQPIPHGIWVVIRKEERDSPPLGARIIFNALSRVGLNPKWMTDDGIPEGSTELFISQSDIKQP